MQEECKGGGSKRERKGRFHPHVPVQPPGQVAAYAAPWAVSNRMNE